MSWSDDIVPGSPAFQIASSEDRRIRVVAGPGTGKSFAMKRRVARLLEVGVPPNAILPVTFTRVAAEDLHRELVGMDVPGCDQLEGRTLHSLAFKILMTAHALAATGRVARPLNDFEIEPLLADLAGNHRGKRNVKKRIRAFEAAWARLQADEPGYVQSPEDAALERDLNNWHRFHKSMLIGEAIPLAYRYLLHNPAAPARTEFSHILIDEFQDLNKAEQGVLQLLSDNASVCVVGDDDQSIYSFKHAHPEGIRQWLAANGGGVDVELGECHRCPSQVVAMANALIGHNLDRPARRSLTPRPQNGPGETQIIQYMTLSDEIRGVSNLIHSLIANGTNPGDILVLAQRGIIGTPIYQTLSAMGIPVRSYYAESELDSEDAQERFAKLKLYVDREDRVALRWLLGLGHNEWHARAYQRLRLHCEEQGITPWQALERLSAGTLVIPHTRPITERFQRVAAELEQLELLTSVTEVIDSLFPAGSAGLEGLRAVALEASLLANGDRGTFLVELSSLIAKPEVPTEVTDVRIMSLHKSKGLSAPVTIIAGCIQGLLPRLPEADLPASEMQAQMEEQRRLLYVGITRVKAAPHLGKPGKLVLTSSQQMPLASAMQAGIQPAHSRFGTAHLVASQFLNEFGPSAPHPIRG